MESLKLMTPFNYLPFIYLLIMYLKVFLSIAKAVIFVILTREILTI